MDTAILLVFFGNNLTGGKYVAMGENSTREAYDGCCYNTHAEMDAIRRLPPLNLRGRKKVITLLVVQFDKLRM